MNTLVRGAFAGAAATVPMTAVIELLNRNLPSQRGVPLPPRQITEEVAQRGEVDGQLGEEGLDAASLAAHFGFGAAAGSLYACSAARLGLHPALGGTAFGLAVWGLAYGGVLPRLALQPRPGRRHPARNLTMIAGHIVWGAALGTAEAALATRRRDETRSRLRNEYLPPPRSRRAHTAAHQPW